MTMTIVTMMTMMMRAIRVLNKWSIECVMWTVLSMMMALSTIIIMVLVIGIILMICMFVVCGHLHRLDLHDPHRVLLLFHIVVGEHEASLEDLHAA